MRTRVHSSEYTLPSRGRPLKRLQTAYSAQTSDALCLGVVGHKTDPSKQLSREIYVSGHKNGYSALLRQPYGVMVGTHACRCGYLLEHTLLALAVARDECFHSLGGRRLLQTHHTHMFGYGHASRYVYLLLIDTVIVITRRKSDVSCEYGSVP